MNDYAFDLEGSVSEFEIPAISTGFVKIHGVGELNGQGRDRRFLLRINGESSGYQGFTKAEGNWGGGEWDQRGIYLGRSGWNLDASFSSEITINIYSHSQKILTHSLTTFVMSDGRMIGYQSAGFLNSNGPLTSIQAYFDGGVARGRAKVLTYGQ